jgi:hypothetical protein
MKKISILQKLFLLAALIPAGAVFCAAQTSGLEIKLDRPVTPQTAVTYLDLLKKVFPDARIDATRPELAQAKEKIPLRNLFGQETSEFLKSGLRGELEIGVVEKAETLHGREKIFWLMIGAAEKGETCDICGNTLLAAYRLRKTEAELIDAASVKTSGRTSFAETSKLRLAPTREAVVTFNSTSVSMGSNSYSIVAIGEKGFAVLLSEFEENFKYQCGSFVYEEVSVRPLKTSAGGYRSLEIIIKAENGWEGDGDREVIENRRRFRYVFDWQPRRAVYKAVVDPGKQRRAFFRKHGCDS